MDASGNSLHGRHARSVQDEQVEPVAPRLGARRIAGPQNRTADAFLPAEELFLGERAHRGVGAAKCVDLTEEVGEAAAVGLANWLKRVRPESGGRERRA